MQQTKIDLVYLWVDGDDKNWQTQKNIWQKKIESTTTISTESKTIARWRNNDELKYSLRSAELFAPWINHIYIITGFNQVPKWLKPNHPKITIVSHETIFPDGALPCFNSTNIEMCLGEIPNLSEYFLLANDDMFFGQPVNPDYFFDKRGRAKVWYCKNHQNKDKETYAQIIENSANTILSIYKKDYTNIRPAHNIDPYIKSDMITAIKYPYVYEKIQEQIMLNKFRQSNERHRWYFNLFDLCNNKAVFYRARNKKSRNHFLYNFIYANIIKKSPQYTTNATKFARMKNKPFLFCLNDTEKSSSQDVRDNANFLGAFLPNKSSFEI